MHKSKLSTLVAIGLIGMVAATSVSLATNDPSTIGLQSPNMLAITLSKPDGETVTQFIGYVDDGTVPVEIKDHKSAKRFETVDALLTDAGQFLSSIDQKDLIFLIDNDANVTALVRNMRLRGIKIPDTCVSRFENLPQLVGYFSQGVLSLEDFAVQNRIVPLADLENPILRNQALPKIYAALATQIKDHGAIQVTGARQAAAARQPTRVAG